MATKHLYVSGDDDLKLWEEAEAVAARERRSVSWVVHQALKTYLRLVEVEEAKRGRGAGRAQA